MDFSQPIPVPTIFGDDITGFIVSSHCWIFTTYSYKPSYWMLLKREGFSGGLVTDSSELDSLTNQLSRDDLTKLYRIHHKTDPDHYFTISLREEVDELILSGRIKVFKLHEDLYPRLIDPNDILYSSQQEDSDAVTAKRNELAEELGYDISTRWLSKDQADKLHWDRGLVTREAYELYDVGAEIVDTAVDFVVSLYQIGKAVVIITGRTLKAVGEFYLNVATGDLDGIRKDLEAVGIWIGDTIDSAEKLIALAKQGLEIFNQIQNDPQSRDLVIDYFSSLYESVAYRDSRTIGVRIVAEVGIEVFLALATAGTANVARRAGQISIKTAQIGRAAERIGPFTKQAVEFLAELTKLLSTRHAAVETLPPPKKVEVPDYGKSKSLDDGANQGKILDDDVAPNKISVHKFDNLDDFNRAANNPKPNSQYEYGNNTWKTDDKGRVIEASGKVKLQKADGRSGTDGVSTVKIGKEGQQGDIGFHLIGDQFDGPTNRLNVVPGNGKRVDPNGPPNLNQGQYAKFERAVKNASTDPKNAGKDIEIKISPQYSKNNTSNRPDTFLTSYKVAGEKPVKYKFKNQQGG